MSDLGHIRSACEDSPIHLEPLGENPLYRASTHIRTLNECIREKLDGDLLEDLKKAEEERRQLKNALQDVLKLLNALPEDSGDVEALVKSAESYANP
jgi:hypothetical protein